MIRPLEEKDFESVYALGNLLNENFSKTNQLDQLLKDPYTKLYVYEENEKIVGFLMYTELEETIDISNIYVEEEYRHKKIASNLLDTMISKMKDTVKLITLEVRKDNEPAISLYQKFGFEIMHIREKYYKDVDAYLMGRRFEI